MTLYAAYTSGDSIEAVGDFSIGGIFGTSIDWKMSNKEVAERIDQLANTMKKVGRNVNFPCDIQVTVDGGKLEYTPYVFLTNQEGKEIRFELEHGGAVVRGGRIKEELFPTNGTNNAKQISRALKRFSKLVREA